MFSANNFIDNTHILPNSSTVIKVNNINNTISYLLVVCQYQKMFLRDNNLLLTMHNSMSPITLDFATKQEAILAQNLLSTLIYNLKRNCISENHSGGTDYEGPITLRINTGLPGDYTWTSPAVPFFIPNPINISNDKIDIFFNGQKLSRDTDYVVSGRNINIKSVSLGSEPYDVEYNCGYAVCIQATDLIEIIIH